MLETSQKRCVKCKLVFDRSRFYPHDGYRDGLNSTCKGCMRINFDQWRKSATGRGVYKETLKRGRAKLAKKIKHIVTFFKTGKPCMDCGEMLNPWQMDFDHRPGVDKKFELSKACDESLTSVRAELAKCDVVCSNCHRNRTYLRLHPEMIPHAA